MKKDGIKLKYKPAVLVILDGWGVAAPSRANAITESHTPYFDELITTYPSMVLQASGQAAGLPWAEVGNSEVGHINIGAGRIVSQELSRITHDILSGRYFDNEIFLKAIKHAKENNSSLHLLGMPSSGGVHSHIDHLMGLLELASQHKLKKVYIHAILDGRDTSRASGKEFIEKIQQKCEELKTGTIATISGRRFAMDRNNHWDRIEKAYNAMTQGLSESTHQDPLELLEQSYKNNIFDEKIPPTVITKENKPIAKISKNDAVVFYNFRPDRARQLSKAFTVPFFNEFNRDFLENLYFATMTEYDKDLPLHVAYPPEEINNTLAEILSWNGLSQLHIAETEKYAHVTYFINGGREKPYNKEDRELIPSPQTKSYEETPEMSAHAVTDAALRAIKAEEHDVIIINYANVDMVGHTGNFERTIKAIETIDNQLKSLVQATLSKNGAVFITADHGNAEKMLNLQTGQINKSHTNNPVPFIVITKDLEGQSMGLADEANGDLSRLEASGMLSDVAPTLLALIGIDRPPEMSGQNLLNL